VASSPESLTVKTDSYPDRRGGLTWVRNPKSDMNFVIVERKELKEDKTADSRRRGSKIGTEFSAFAGVEFNTKNDAIDYQSGDIFHVDATLAQHLPLFGGFVGAGATAFYLKQISGDGGSGAKLGSSKAESYGVGPTVSYVHPIGKSTLVVDGSWLPQLHNDNTTKGNYWWVKLTLAF
jgi:hypothetical protein